MTDTEFTTFARRLFIVFPDVWEWLQDKSPDPAETQKVWREVLRPYRLDECLLVIDSWLTRKRPAPKAYERGLIAINIAASIQHDRDQESRFSFAEQSSEDVRAKRKAYRPIEADQPSMAAALRAGRKLMSDRDKGEMTEAEFYKRKQEILNAL